MFFEPGDVEIIGDRTDSQNQKIVFQIILSAMYVASRKIKAFYLVLHKLRVAVPYQFANGKSDNAFQVQIIGRGFGGGSGLVKSGGVGLVWVAVYQNYPVLVLKPELFHAFAQKPRRAQSPES